MLALLLALAAPVPKGDPWPVPPAVAPRKTADPLVKLLQDDRLDEAAYHHNGQGPPAPDWLFQRADQAAADGRTSDALCLYEAYLRHFPLGYDSNDIGDAGMPGSRLPRSDEWRRAAGDYLALRAKAENPDAGWFRQSREAVATYDQFLQAYRRKDAPAYLKLADEIVEKYPRSLFCEPAVLTACYGRTIHGHGLGFAPAAFVKGYLDKLAKVGVPPEGRVHVTLFYHERAAREDDGTPARKFTPLVTPVELAKLTTSAPLRKSILQNALVERLNARDSVASRESGAALLAAYPDALRPQARRALVNTLLIWTQSPRAAGEAEWWLREWVRDKKTFGEGDLLAVVADRHAEAGRTDEAVALYELTLDHDTRLGAGQARWGLATVHRKRGDEAKMLARLKELGEAKTAGPYHEMAKEALGDHYTAKKEWAEALKWWEAWRGVESGCGLGAIEAEAKKQKMIATCRAMLKP